MVRCRDRQVAVGRAEANEREFARLRTWLGGIRVGHFDADPLFVVQNRHGRFGGRADAIRVAHGEVEDGGFLAFDERIVQHFCSDTLSIGRYVIAGGELAAMVVADAVLRKLPGSLGHAESAAEALGPNFQFPAACPILHGQ